MKKLPETFVVRKNFGFDNMLERDSVYDKLEKVFEKTKGEINTLDGVKVVFSDGWFMFRKSNTEPIIRFSSESKEKRIAEKFLRDFKKLF